MSGEKKTEALLDFVSSTYASSIRRALVVGCGDGKEAAVLSRKLSADVIGIDTGQEFSFDTESSKVASLRIGDATQMEFAPSTFDFVYSFHVLEHIPRYQLALKENNRVLIPGGVFMIGVPNESRLVGYLSSDIELKAKLQWNLNDWRKRLNSLLKMS